MQFDAIGYTNIGTTKKSNQDSYCIKIADTKFGQVALVAVADGMGGLSKGELASATVIQALSHWFENDLMDTLDVLDSSVSGLEGHLTGEWNGFIQKLNLKIMKYGRDNHINLGTTLTAMLFIGARYSIVHVGDSRAYEIASDKITQLTEDQTYVHREVKAGRMTEEEAAVHPKRNVLLQCIGSSQVVNPSVIHGNAKKGTRYLICSDGFRHHLDDKDMLSLCSFQFDDEVQSQLYNLTEKVKLKGETDNITSALIEVKGSN